MEDKMQAAFQTGLPRPKQAEEGLYRFIDPSRYAKIIKQHEYHKATNEADRRLQMLIDLLQQQ